MVRLFNNSNNSRMVSSKCNSNNSSQQFLQVRTRMDWQESRAGQWCLHIRTLTGCLETLAVDLDLVSTLRH